MEIMSPCLAHSRCCLMGFIIIAFLFLLGLLLLAWISFPILPDSIRASGYPSVVLVCLKKVLKNGIDFIPIFLRNISLNTILLPLSWDKVEKTHLANWINNPTMCLLGVLQKGSHRLSIKQTPEPCDLGGQKGKGVSHSPWLSVLEYLSSF